MARKYGKNNVMLNQYDEFNRNNVLYPQNNLMKNLFINGQNIKDPMFIQQMQNKRLEEFRNINKLSDLKISQKDLQDIIQKM